MRSQSQDVEQRHEFSIRVGNKATPAGELTLSASDRASGAGAATSGIGLSCCCSCGGACGCCSSASCGGRSAMLGVQYRRVLEERVRSSRTFGRAAKCVSGLRGESRVREIITKAEL